MEIISVVPKKGPPRRINTNILPIVIPFIDPAPCMISHLDPIHIHKKILEFPEP